MQRIMIMQHESEKLCPQYSFHIRKLCKHFGSLIDTIKLLDKRCLKTTIYGIQQKLFFYRLLMLGSPEYILRIGVLQKSEYFVGLYLHTYFKILQSSKILVREDTE